MNRLLFIFLVNFTILFSQESLVKHRFINLEINDKNATFGAAYYGNNRIVFTATKNGNFDLFVADIEDGILKNYAPLSNVLNTHLDETNATFTNDFKTIYFTRSIKGRINSKKRNKRASLGIYKATLSEKGVWQNIKPMPFNNANYDVAHPALSKDNKTLYFTSNMPGTLGDNDIFEVKIDKGFYGKPRNLGNKVNTKGKEMFPFIADDNFLYFASDGKKEGFGGLDVYYVQINGSATTKSVHLKAPINSKWDDFSYLFNSNTRVGFVSSNRPGVGNDDLYMFKEERKKEKKEIAKKITKGCEQSLVGVVYHNEVRNVVSNANIVLKDVFGKEIAKKTTRSNARYSFRLKCNKKYILYGSRDGFVAGSVSFSSGNENFEVTKQNLNLEMAEVMKTYQTVSGNIKFSFNDFNLKDSDTYELEKAAILMRQNQKLKVIIESHTDSKGDPAKNMELTDKRVAVISNYFINNGIEESRVISKSFGGTKPLNKCKKNVICTTKERLKNRRTTYRLTEENN